MSGSAPPPKAPYTVWSIVWPFLLGLLLTALFFRSVLPRLPQILFRGKLRIKRAGLRGIRGIEYRSKGFHNDSAAFSRHEDQLEVKVQRLYASFHLPYFLSSNKQCPNVVPRSSAAIVTVHVQGVGVRLPRSRHEHARKSTDTSVTSSPDAGTTPPAGHDATENITLEQQEEARLQRLMSSPPMSPSLQDQRSFSSSFQDATAANSAGQDGDHDVETSHQPQGSSLYLTCHRAGLLSIHSVLRMASWFRCAALPAVQSLVLRAFRAALFILSSGLPVLTSLISIEVDRIEVYVQEAEAVARVGRVGLTFSMSSGSHPSTSSPPDAKQSSDDQQRAFSYFQAPTWAHFCDTMRSMPTRVGSGARDVATYLVAGISLSTVAAHLRIDSIDLFEAKFKPEPMKESQQDGASPSSHPSHPKHVRSSSSASSSSSTKRTSASLRGLADLWADWALEPLVDSDFHADSGWTRQHLDQGVSQQQLQAIPAAARIASISGLTELTASLLVGSDAALGGDRTLAARLQLGNISLGLDAAHRAMCVLEERKARRSGWAPKHTGSSPNHRRSVLSKHLVQQRPSSAVKALRMVSSVAVSLPSVRVTASSDALLSSNSDYADDSNAPLPSREFGISFTGFSLELKESDQSDHLHRRWLGTCGLPMKSTAGKSARAQKKGKVAELPRRKHNKSLPHGAKAIEHRRVFLTELSLASLDVRCGTRERGRGSRLLSVDDFSVVARSSWTPFGLFAAGPEVSRYLFEGDPNEHAALIEAAVGGIETDVSLSDIAAIIPIADEFSRRRKKKRVQVGIQEPPRPKTDLERFRHVPRIAGGFHIARISLLLDASQHTKASLSHQHEGLQGQTSRKFTLTIPDVDFVFSGEYRDEYVKRPAAEKRAAYKALKTDSLEWPLSGNTGATAARSDRDARQRTGKDRQGDAATKAADPASLPTTPQPSSQPDERYAESGLTMQETLKRMQEMQKRMEEGQGKPSETSRRPSLRDTMAKTGKVRTPGYSQRPSLAAETYFNLRYQFETSLRVDAVESFLTLGSAVEGSSGSVASSPNDSSAPADEATQYHLIALHSVEVHGSGRIPGRAEPRGFPLHSDIPTLSAPDTVSEFRANIEDIDIEAWQMPALETYADIGAAITQAMQARKRAGKGNEADDHSTDAPADHADAAHASSKSDSTAKPFVERLPGGLSLYLSIGRTIAHLGGTDRRIEDKVARGVGFESKRIVIEYAGVTETKTNALVAKTNWGARTALELSEDLQLQALSLAGRHGRVSLARIALHEAGIFPMLDAELATQQHTDGTASETFAQAKVPQGETWPEQPQSEDASERPATSLLADGVWTFNKNKAHVYSTKQHRPGFLQQDRSNFVMFLPYAAFKAVVKPPQAEHKPVLAGTSEDEVVITAEDTNLMSFNIDILHTYCFLLAFSTFKHLAIRAKGGPRPAASPDADPKTQTSPKPKKHSKPSVSCRIEIKEVHTFVTLPRSTRLFLRIRRLEVRQDQREGLSVSMETVTAAVESPKHLDGDVWEEAVRFRDWRVMLPPKVPGKKLRIIVSGDAALIRIPFGYVVFPIIDNTTVAVKATKQLLYQFLHDKDDSIITPYAEDPKLLPDIEFKLRVLTLEAEDDPFETKLNLIWRAGFAENIAREEREVAFAAKAEAIAAAKMAQSTSTFATRRSNDSLRSAASSIRSDSSDDDDFSTASSTSSHDARSTKSEQQHISYDQAKIALDAFNSSSWVRRYVNAQTEQTRRQEAVLKHIYGRLSFKRTHDELPIKLLPMSKAAPLFRSTMHHVALNVGQASFPVEHLRDFIHEKGAGVPKDTPYSLLIPLHMKWEMNEWRIALRDYPMPLLHIPPTHRAANDPRKAWCFEGDIVIAEQLGGPESIRHVPAIIVPAATGRPEAVEYGIIVPKVAMSVKMYGTPTVRLQTPYPTRLVWGQSMQPAIQDLVRVIDGITPPPHDPSPKLGFWDKLPMILHGHVNLKFEDEGGFNIHLKGCRDPYSIEGHGAGWVKSWKGNVEIRIGYDNPEKEFFQILSQGFVLAIPDLSDYLDHAATGSDHHRGRQQPMRDHDGESSYHDSYDGKSLDASVTSSMARYMKDPTFRKTVIRLTDGVRWGAGLHGERTCDDETCPRHPKCHGEPFYRECRNFQRIHHWDVIPKTREHFASIPESERRDSFRGWRSNHLHLSISVVSPKNGIPGYTCSEDVAKGVALNNFYLSPLTWEHFFSWMRLFNSALSLPIRAGKLFPDTPPPSPKFGRFLGTIKYRLDLAPLFIAHQYRQHNKEDWARGLRTHVGVKARIDAFTLDMHQRQQETVKERPELGGPRIVFHKPFYEAEVKCDGIDLKTFAARMREDAGTMESPMEDHEVGENMLDDLFAEDVIISDDELEWIDMNDLVELDVEAIKDPSPKIRMFPTMVCPQFVYYRKVDSKRERRAREMQDRAAKGRRSHNENGDNIEDLLARLERSKFGNEDTHVCMVGHNDKPYGVQRKLTQDRLQTIRREIERVLNASDHGSAASSADSEGSEGSEDSQSRLNDLHAREKILSGFISHLGRLQEHTDHCERARAEGKPLPKRTAPINRNYSLSAADIASLYHDLGTFDNRYIAHNPTLFFSNITRTLLLKYYYSSRLRRGYAHHMTATAVKYIRDLLHKKDKSDRASAADAKHRNRSYNSRSTPKHLTPTAEGQSGLDILHEMLEDTVNHLSGKHGYSKTGWGCKSEDDGDGDEERELQPTDGISDDFDVAKSNVCLLLKPQVVLRSEIDDKSTVIVTALRTRLQNYSVLDESCAEDSVNAIVLRRTFFALDNLQCYHPNPHAQSVVKQHEIVSLPLETLVDVNGHSRDFERIVPHTNATVYYDKFNKLRLSDSSRSVATFRRDGKPVQDHLHHHMDMILLNCPRFSVSANSEHFAALYNVVTDLILYRDPAHRDHAKRLEEMMFSYDFTDVSGLADIVTALQLRIRDARSLVDQYQSVSSLLNERGRLEFNALRGEMVDLVEELNLIMDAITTSQDSQGGADREKKSALRFMAQAQEVAWNMLGDEAGQLVAKLAVRGVSFSWLNKADNSAANTLSIQDLQALNVHPDALFAEIITKHTRAKDHPMAKEGRFVDAMWSVLPPVGGISIVDVFEFNLHPVKIQIEMLVGRKIMDYVFGTKRQREKQEEEQKRLEDEANRPVSSAEIKKKSPLARLLGGRKQNAANSGSESTLGSRRASTNASTPSLPTVPSRTASTSDLPSIGRPSSDSSRDDDSDSITAGRAPTKSLTTALKTSPKSRPGTPSSAKDKDSSGTTDKPRPGDQFAIAQRNAAEMRSRASAYRTFVYVKVSETIFCLSYKGEKQKSITDLYDLVFRTPKFEYHNSTFGYVDLADNFKKDVFKAAWNQKSTLLKDIITHRPNRKRNAIESIRAIRQASRARESLAPLDISVEPPTPTGRSSIDDGSSSHMVESPTDNFSLGGDVGGHEGYYDDEEHHGHGHRHSYDDEEEEGELYGVPGLGGSKDRGGDEEHDEAVGNGHNRTRNGTEQTLAGQIRDAWGRSNEAAASSSDEPQPRSRASTAGGEVDEHLASPHRTPQSEAGTEREHHTRRFPTLPARWHHHHNSVNSNNRSAEWSPSTERGGDGGTLTASHSHSTALSSPGRSTSPFKLNKLIPKTFRPRSSSSNTLMSVRRRNSHSGGQVERSSPLNDHAPGTGAGGHGVGEEEETGSKAVSSGVENGARS